MTSNVGTRVVSQNLLVSAAQAENTESVDSNSIRDLASLINLAVLNDDLFVLGRATDYHIYGPTSDIISFLVSEKILRTESMDEAQIAATTISAKRHLAAFLGDRLDNYFSDLLRNALSPNDVEYALVDTPDGGEEVRIGGEWLKTVPAGTDLVAALREEREFSRSTTFVLRTFLYLGYAGTLGIAFVPDAARANLINDVVKRQNAFVTERLLTELQRKFETIPEPQPYDARALVSPFAAVAFQRCGGDRSRLVREVERLREEFRPVRGTLRELQKDIEHDDRKRAIAAENKWFKILDEAARIFGRHPGLISLKEGTAFSGNVADVVDDYTSAKAWVKALAELPLTLVQRVLRRRKLAEIHTLSSELPGPTAVREAVHKLFGNVDEEAFT